MFVLHWIEICPQAILTGIGLLMMDPLVLGDLCSRFSTCIVCASIKVDGIFSMGQKAVAMVIGVMDPLGVCGFNMYDMAITS